jgi:CRP-like cAMP-binding protein
MPATLSILNKLLLALTPEDLDRLHPHLELITLVQKQILSKPNAPIEHVHFVQDGMVSIVQVLEDGVDAEVGVIGSEGFDGMPVLLGAETSPLEAMVQLPGFALRLPASALRDAVALSPALSELLLRYVQAFHIQVSMCAGCNLRHNLPERLARWLLIARDRAASDRLRLTHEFLSIMLGVRRPGITVALGALRAAKLIYNGHGHVTIIDRPGLEAACCECYGVVRNEYKRLLP